MEGGKSWSDVIGVGKMYAGRHIDSARQRAAVFSGIETAGGARGFNRRYPQLCVMAGEKRAQLCIRIAI